MFTFKPSVPWSKVAILGMAIPPLIGNLYNGYINPSYWVDEFVPYYMEIMGVDRPDRTSGIDCTPPTLVRGASLKICCCATSFMMLCYR